MLEVKHLTKTYKSKGGVIVKALNDVSLNFPETGMVFLLGKSGSGKSTLLNVCGGLDEPTSGEIIVKGRSSKNFTQSDFDSYRNTFIGFIFQEYNILNEFTVEENIALALELQGKSKDKEAIDNLLKQVDLEGFAKRKPNTLSGGQKQRIAIARALIKEPEIIMADEPTGALDSVTGRQVLETLKKLSKDKLVIVVSHDHEFAANYGDRIIELKDGKVIKDITKTHEKEQNLSNNVSVIGDVLCVKKGSKLSDKEFDEIKTFLNNSENDIIVAKGEHDVKEFKRVSHITTNGEKEVFKDTDETKINKKEYKKEDSRFIRSKLPLKHAFKIGVSSLKNKPVRLFFTILLCTISFVLFGILSTMTFYDSEATFKETLKNSDYSLIKLNKEYRADELIYSYGVEEYSYTNLYDTRFSQEEFNNYVEQFGIDTFAGIKVDTNFTVQTSTSNYWLNTISTMAYLETNNSLRTKIDGRYPENDDEICISSYTANVIYNNKIYDADTNKTLQLSNPKDVLGKKITIGSYTYKIVGIIDSGELNSKYDEILNSESVNIGLQNSFYNYLYDELHLVSFVSKDKLESISKEYIPYSNDMFTYRRISTAMYKNNKYTFPEWANAAYGEYSKENIIKLTSFDEIKDNEVVVSKDMFYELIMEYYSESNDWNNYELALELQQKGYYKEDKFIKFTEKEMTEKLNNLINNYKKGNKKLKLGVRLFDDFNQVSIGEEKEFNVVGVFDDVVSNYESRILLFSNNIVNELWNTQKINLMHYMEARTKYKNENTIYETIYLPFDKTDEKVNMIWDIYESGYKEDDSKHSFTSYTISNLEMIDSLINDLSKVFLYVGIVLAVFSILLFSNFISVSISNKKREIGILRAVGARSFDVFKIFFSESFVITMICVLLSVIGSATVCNLLNQELSKGIGASIFVFGITSLLILIIIALITALLATFLPVYNAARKKPVDSIRAL